MTDLASQVAEQQVTIEELKSLLQNAGAVIKAHLKSILENSDSRNKLSLPAQSRSHQYTSPVSPTTPMRYTSTITIKQIRTVKAKIPGYYDDLVNGEKSSIEQKLQDLFKALAQDSYSYALVKALWRASPGNVGRSGNGLSYRNGASPLMPCPTLF
ncbi:hypothetical protein BDP27DRAFT_1366487 [Rhodocollybia butyracea]|uniref:Uncharacterized protein n=1 Tax=Rhodocollybia butyracea TaxID=206335 RepID=A0A9P5PHC0_9AGAR|nr:hypothetical protein BDP27DRAFT_1366487 [Rhodocollybia butyracea]